MTNKEEDNKIFWEPQTISVEELKKLVHDLAYVVDNMAFEWEDCEQYYTSKPRYTFYENKIWEFLVNRWLIDSDDIP